MADFQIKLEDGTLGKAGEALEAVHLLDPFRPDFDALKATLERARTRRELAFSSEELSFEERKERLDAYLELAKHDEAAANRLREVKVELKRQAELRALEGALRELAAAGAWTEAKQKAEELRLRDEGNAVAAEVGAKARLELDRDAILALVSGFDETLVGDPEALASLLPNPTERRAWKDFLAFDGRFSASKHTIDREAISVSGQQAELEGLWAFELALLDQPAQALERRQRIALERTDQGWTFRSFEVLE